ncbi:uncharacterized protein RBU33_017978 isoform 8-T13 [Hipposideros larvatus]
MLSDVKETMRKSLDKTYLEWFGRGLGHLPLFQLDFPGRVSQQLETPLAQGQSSFVLLSPLCHLSHPLSLGTLTSSLEPNQGSSAEPSAFNSSGRKIINLRDTRLERYLMKPGKDIGKQEYLFNLKSRPSFSLVVEALIYKRIYLLAAHQALELSIWQKMEKINRIA